MANQSKTVYLPSVYDPQKLREGIVEIINLVKGLELNKEMKKTG